MSTKLTTCVRHGRSLPCQLCKLSSRMQRLKDEVDAETDAMNAAAKHASDCAVHNAPAEPRGPCDCGASALHRWRVGRKLGRTIYCDDVLVGMMDTPAMASNVVACLNAITGGGLDLSLIRICDGLYDFGTHCVVSERHDGGVLAQFLGEPMEHPGLIDGCRVLVSLTPLTPHPNLRK